MNQIQSDGTQITLIHLAYSHDESRAPGSWRLACMPNMTDLGETISHKNYQHTDDPRAATCPACKRTQKFMHLKSRTDALSR